MTPAIDLLARRAQLSPDVVALIDAATRIETTYAAWNRRTNQTARLLSSLGVGTGDRVAVYSSNNAEYLDLIFAIPKLGAVTFNLNWRLTPAELSRMIVEARPTVLAYSSEWSEQVAQLGDAFDGLTLLSMDDVEGDAALSARDGLPDDDLPELELDMDHPWGIYPTGGTTGLPKGAVLTHGNVLWNAINTTSSWGVHAGHTAPIQLPLFHIGGPNIFMLPLVHVGGTSVVCEAFDPGETLALVDSGLITHYVAVPTMYQMLLEHPAFESTDFSRMELVISGGAPCPLPIMERFWERGVDFKTGYGLTEASGNNFWLPPGQVRQKPGSVGYPLMHIRARVIDDAGTPCPPDVPGNLELAGPHVFAGYWKRPDATAEALVDGWLRTGDVAVCDADGAYRIIGRSKEMYISGGENVYPAEVESVIAGHPAVVEVAVVGVPDDRWGEVGAAFVSVRPGRGLEVDELISFCSQRLARYKLPRHVRLLPELPKTAIGKHDKKAMRAAMTSGERV